MPMRPLPTAPLAHPMQSWSSSALSFAPKGRLLMRLQHHPWALSLLPALLLLRLLRGRALHFADAPTEARYSSWLGARSAARDLLLHAIWLAAGTYLYVQARHGLEELDEAIPGMHEVRSALAACGDLQRCALAALALLTLVAPAVPAALVVVLRRRWYTRHREEVLIATRLAQALAALALHCSAPLRLDAAWPLVAAVHLICTLLMRVRFSTFLPAQLLHVLIAASTCATHGARAGGVLHYSRLIGLGWCAPGLLVFALETSSRRAFVQCVLNKGGRQPLKKLHPPPATVLAL